MSGQERPHLTELRKLAGEATPGPWYAVVNDLIGGKSVSTVNKPMSETRLREQRVPADMLATDADAAYIAAVSPDVVLGLLDEISALRSAAAPVPGEAPEQQPKDVDVDCNAFPPESAPAVRADAEAERAFSQWCEAANYAADDREAPHTEAFFAGYNAAANNEKGRSEERPPIVSDDPPPQRMSDGLEGSLPSAAAVASPAPEPAPPESARVASAGEDQSPLALGCGCPWEDYGDGAAAVRRTYHEPDCQWPALASASALSRAAVNTGEAAEAQWLIHFDDADRANEVFRGNGAEAAARARSIDAAGAWDHTLFVEVDALDALLAERTTLREGGVQTQEAGIGVHKSVDAPDGEAARVPAVTPAQPQAVPSSVPASQGKEL